MWIEIHCDIGIKHNDECANMTHDYGTSLSDDLKKGYAHAAAMARQMGWKQNRSKTKWFCRNCVRKFDTNTLVRLSRHC